MPTALAHAVALGIHAVPERSGALRRIGARDAIRNRTRTAATTGALMLATAVVVGLAVFLSSFASSLNSDVSGLVSADLVIDSGTFTVGSLPKGLIDQVSEVDGVRSVSGWQLGRVSINQIPVRVTGMDGSSLPDVIAPEWVGKAPRTLSREGIALSRSLADQLGVNLGAEIPVFFASYATVTMTVEGIYDSGEVLLGGAVVNRSLLTEQIPKSNDIFALVSLKKDSPDARATVTKLAKSFGVKSVLRPEDFVDSRSALLKGFERVIQWMLLFTLLQALVGVVNTLLLSVGERRREFGLLRAAGASRRQVLRLVLVEGGSFAVVGTVLGLVVGIVAARVAIGALGQFGITGFTVPIPIVIITALAASSLGVIAAVIPARWAAAVPPLEAVMDSGGDASEVGLLRRAQTWITERQAAKSAKVSQVGPAAPVAGTAPGGTVSRTAQGVASGQSMPAGQAGGHAPTAAAAVRKLSVAPLSGPSAPPAVDSGSVAEAARAVVPPPFDPTRL
ncbi:MAG: FtsX-like permease family protein, partial [Microthrixaceae bacterium]